MSLASDVWWVGIYLWDRVYALEGLGEIIPALKLISHKTSSHGFQPDQLPIILPRIPFTDQMAKEHVA
ncbi:hypothetical protein RSAG8_03656, partial [Rhizoctonia solani AG-8 WAC10335]